MMWCVRTLFMSADVYDRDSTTLATYPEIGKSRRTILLAFGKIYPQCWIANGDRAGYSARDRQLAAEKMGQLGQQIARGVKNFTIRAKKCGLLVNIPGHELRMSDLDFTAFDAKDAMAALGISAKEYGEAAEPVSSGLSVNTLSSGSISASAVSPKSTGSASNIRNRRRVSRANSIKGFKSFNAIRQLRAEHASRYAAAKVSIEHLIADLMECLNDVEGACNLDNLIQHSIQASQMVTIFLASMDEMKAKITPSNSTEQSNNNSSGSNNKDASKQRAELSRTLKDLATFIETLDSRPSRNLQEEHLTIEESLTRLMTLTSNILRCLLDMDIPHRSSSISQDSSLSSDFFAGLPSSGSRGSGDNGRLSVSKSHLQQKNGSTSSINSLKSASTSTKNPAPASSSNARPPTTPACNLMSIGGSKIASLNSLTDLADQQSLDNDPNFGSTIGGGEKDSFMLDPRIAYSEAYGPESLGTGPYRATHDSAVVMLSGESTPHQSLITGPRKAIQTPVVERPVSPMEIEDVIEWTAEVPQPLVERRTDERKALREPSARAATPVIQPSKVSLEAERARVERSPVQKSTKVFGQIETLGEAAAHTDATTAKAFSPASQSSATFPTSSPVVEAKARLEVTEIPPPSMRNQRPRRSNPNTPASPEPSSTSPMIGPQNARRRTPRAPSTEPTLVRPPNSPKESIASASSPNVNKSKDLPKIPSSTAVTYTSIVPVKAETFTIVQEPELVQEYLSVTGLGIQMPQDSSTPSLGTRLPRRPTSPATERASSRPSGIARARSPAPPVPNIGRETVSSRNRRVDNTFSIQSTTSGISSVSTTPSTRLSGSGSMIKLFGSSGLQAPASSRKRNSLVASRTSSDQQQGSGDHPPPPPPKRGSRSTQSDVADREVTAPGTRSSAGKRATPSIRSPSPSSVVQFPAAVRDSHQNKLKQQNTRRDSIQSIQSNLTTASFEMIGGRGDPILASQRASAAKSSRASPGTNSGQYAPSIQSNRSHRLSSDSHHLQHVPQTPPIRPWREPHSQQPSPQLGPSIMRRGISTDDVHPSRPHGLPWFLSHDHSPDEVLFNEENALQAATLEAMIEILTSHRASPDPSYVTTFFATFRLFTTPVELTTMLVSRFQKSPPAGLSEGELHTWKKQKLEIIQRRVQIAFKTWLDGYWFSPKDREAFKLIMDFVTKDMAVVLPVQAGRMQEMLTLWTTKRQSLNFAAQRPASLTKARSYDRVHQLPNDSSPSSSTGTTPSTISSGTSSSISGTSSVRDNSFDRSLKGTRKSLRRGIGLGRDSIYVKSPPAPQVTKTLLNALMKEDSMRLVPVTDIKPLELARQLTLYVNKLFLSIPYLELLDEERPNCPKMIQTANKITAWVTDTIVDEQDVKKRISILKYWIEVCEECVKLNNFDSLTAIVCAIESTPVKRLDITWEGVNKGYRERLVQLHAMISNENNYKKYRAKLKEVQAPCIPFLGLYLTTVMMIKDGNSMYKDPNVKSILPSSRQSHASSRISASSSVSMGGQNAAAAAASSPVPSPSMSAVTTTSSAPKPKLLRYVRFSRLATSVLEFRNFQGQYEYLEVQPLRNYIEHKLNSTDPQDSDRNYRKSYAIEPRYHPPAPPGTALPPPGHYRPMPTSYLSQSSVAGAQSGQQPSSQSTLNRANQHQSMPSQPSSSVQHSRTSSQSSSYLSGGGLATAVFNPHHSHPVPPPLPPKVPTSKANKFSRLWRSGRTYSRQP
ncbi:hypothetical protein BGZ73_007570 [Actinomortierella ambigua]|nr:hypothetical protein BGZ73_007570 [Actinomortierella ambigua]